MKPLKDEIDEQIEASILEPVQETPETIYWLHPIVVVPKKGTSKVRLCVDFRRLNQFCIRPSNPEGTPWEQIRALPSGKRWYAVFDANKGYHQVPLDNDSKPSTTFFTPHGKYRYLSLPMGYTGSQDIFTQRLGLLLTTRSMPGPPRIASSPPTARRNFSTRLKNSSRLAATLVSP